MPDIYTLRARCVLPIETPALDGGLVVCRDERILEVGAREAAGELIDLGDVLLLPALVNAHTHLEFSHLHAPLGRPGMSLPQWLQAAVASRSGATFDAAAIAAGAAESARFGVAVLGEIAQRSDSVDELSDALAGVAYLEARGLDPARVDELAAAAAAHLAQTYRKRFRAGLSPHAPYSLHVATLDCLVKIAAAHGAPVAMHLAESRDELELLASGTGPFRDLLARLGVAWRPDATASRVVDYLNILSLADRVAVIHGNFLGDEEVALLAERRDRFAVVYCPRTHAYFEHALHPAPRLLAAGVRVAIGTDSRASTPDLNLLADLRTAAASVPSVPPAAWLRAATLDAAWALGLDADFGDVSAGRIARFVAVPYSGGDPYEALLTARSATPLFSRAQIIAARRS